MFVEVFFFLSAWLFHVSEAILSFSQDPKIYLNKVILESKWKSIYLCNLLLRYFIFGPPDQGLNQGPEYSNSMPLVKTVELLPLPSVFLSDLKNSVSWVRCSSYQFNDPCSNPSQGTEKFRKNLADGFQVCIF